MIEPLTKYILLIKTGILKKAKNIFFIIGIVSIVIMILTFDVSFTELWRDLCKTGFWLLAIFGLWAVLYTMNALSWYVILRGSGECPVSFLYLLKVTTTGFALNYATPIGLLGGEPYKIMEMTPHVGGQRASSSVVLFAMMHVFAHIWYWITGIVLYLLLAMLGILPLNYVMATILALAGVFCFSGVYLFVRGYKNGMVVKLIKIVCHIPGFRCWANNFVETHAEDLNKIDQQIAELQGQNKHCFWESFLCEYVGRVMQSLEIFFMLILFDAGSMSLLTFTYSILILSFTSLFANLLFFLPLQLGGREGGFAMSITQMGMTPEIAMFVSIICRVREVFWTFIGIMLMKIENKTK